MLAADAEAEMELQPETASFRKTQLMRWQTLRDTFVESKGAAPNLGELRAFLSSTLTSTPVNAVAQFVARNQTRWRGDSHSILNCYDDVAELVMSAYPRRTWSTTPTLARDAAADNLVWSEWVHQWSENVSAASPATGAVLNASRGTFAQMRQQAGAFMRSEGAFDLFKTIGGIALQVVLGVEEKRRGTASDECGSSPITIESVMQEAQCHIPKLKDALAGFINNEEVTDVLGVLVGTTDLVTSLKTLAGLVPPSRPASASPSDRSVPNTPQAPPDKPVPPGETRQRRVALAGYLPELDQGDARDWVSTLLVSAPRSVRPRSKAEPPIPATAPVAASSAMSNATVLSRVDEGELSREVVAQELANCEAWVEEQSKSSRARGDALAARIDAFLESTGLGLNAAPPPDFNDPADTAAALAAATVIQTAHFPKTAPHEDARIQALIDQTKSRLERRYNLDDQFMAWLEDRLVAAQGILSGAIPRGQDKREDGHVAV